MGEAAGEVTRWEDRPSGEDLAADDATTDPEVEQLVGEIEVTRVEMTGTVEEIGDRLDPKNVVANAKETVREATVGKVETMVSDAGQSVQEAGNGLLETIKRNPLPAAMAGIGIGWLAMAARGQGQASRPWGGSGWGSSPTYELRSNYGDQYGQYRGGQPTSWDTSRMGEGNGRGVGDKVGDKLGQAGDAASSAVTSAQQTAGDVVGNVQQTAGQLADTVGQRAEQGAQQVQTVARDVGYTTNRAYHENPLAFGAIAMAVGTAVGLALPATRAERNVLGSARDQLIDRAEQTATQALSSAEQQVREQETAASR
jgi:hypothetical protein